MVSEGEITLDCTELNTCKHEPLNSGTLHTHCIPQKKVFVAHSLNICSLPSTDYKNNLLKERGMAKDCNMGEFIK